MMLSHSDTHISLILVNGIGFESHLSCNRRMLPCKSFRSIQKREYLADCLFLVYSCEEPSTSWIAGCFQLESFRPLQLNTLES
jgi:hypothetical protein